MPTKKEKPKSVEFPKIDVKMFPQDVINFIKSLDLSNKDDLESLKELENYASNLQG